MRDEQDRLRHQAMAGWPIPGTQIRVVDAHMKDVPRDMSSVGEVVISGDNVMDGYFREPEATAAVMIGPGFIQAIWPYGTRKAISISSTARRTSSSAAARISLPSKSRTRLPRIPRCSKSPWSAPDPVWGEIPVAFVVLRQDSVVTEQELQTFIGARLAKFKMPRRYEFLHEPLPKGGTGKILKRELREQFWAGKERRVQG